MLILMITSFVGLLTVEPEPKLSLPDNEQGVLTAARHYAEANLLAQETQYYNAITCFKEALTIYEKNDSTTLYLDCLNHLSSQFRKLSRYDSAKAYAIAARSALGLLQSHDPARTVKTYKNIGAYYDVTHQFDSALFYYNESLAIAKKEVNVLRDFVPELYDAIGGVYQSLGDYDTATIYADKAISLSTKLYGNKHLTVANSYRNKARILVELEDYEVALTYFNRTLQIQQELLNACHPNIADTYSNMAVVHDWNWKFQLALSYHFRALAILQETFGDEHIDVIESYDNIAGIYTSLQNFDKAKVYYHKALKLAHKVLGEAHPTTSNLYLSLGVNYGNNGHEDIALEYFLKELEMCKRTNGENHLNTSYSYYNLGMYWRDRGDTRKAFKHFQKALKIRTSALGEQTHKVTDILMAIGVAHEDEQQYDSAGYYYTRAHNINQLISNGLSPQLAISYNSLGFIQEQIGNYDSARQLAQKALAIQTELFGIHHAHVAYSYNRLGHLTYLMHQPKEAIHYFNMGLKANVKIPADPINLDNLSPEDFHDDGYVIESLQGIARVHEELYQKEGDNSLLKVALNHLLRGEKLLEVARQNLVRNGDRIYHSKINALFYRQAVRVCYNLYKTLKDETYLDHAYRFSQKTKANALSDLVMELSAKNASQIPPLLKNLEDTLKKDISFCQTKINKLESQLEMDSLHRFYSNRIFDQKRKYDSLIQYFEENYPKYYTLKHRNYLFDVDSLQTYVDADEAILEFFIGKESIFLFALTGKTQSFYQIQKPEYFEKDIKHFRDLLSMNPLTKENDSLDQALYSYASGIYKNYLHQALEKLDSTKLKLVIIPDGVLGYLPFDMLITRESAVNKSSDSRERYLYEKYQISYAHSAALKFGRFTQRETPDKKILAFAPSYQNDNTDTYFASSRVKVDELSPLIWNVKEVQSIIKLNGGLALTGQQAQEKEFKASSRDYKVLHIAGHAITDDHNPMKSRLAFGQPMDDTEDGFLHAYEIYDMNISAELTVLSACQTAYGQLAQGEGVMSMARAFSASGCPSLLVSHWPVDDRVTSQIMIHFYNYLSQGLRKDEALRLAKMEFLKAAPPTYQHPYFWSSFVLIGNTDPIIFDQKPPLTIRYYFIIFLTILALTYVLWRTRRSLPTTVHKINST